MQQFCFTYQALLRKIKAVHYSVPQHSDTKRGVLLLGLSLVFFLSFHSLSAQEVIVDEISVQGNKKTRKYVILRELTFKLGDTLNLENLVDEVFVQNRLFLLNTGLFNEVLFNIKDWDTDNKRIHIEISVRENIAVFPIPIFELADRNFNVWWTEMKRDLQRVNIGLSLYHINLTGRDDPLKLTYQTGYTRKMELEYELPGFNKKRTLGLFFNTLRTRNREIPYRTSGDILQFRRSDTDFLFNRFRSSLALVYRPKFFSFQRLELFFHRNKITDFVKDELNPDFFGNDQTRLTYFALAYQWMTDNRDLKVFAQKGNFATVTLRKDGLGITKDRNALSLKARYSHYFKMKERWSLEMTTQARYNFIREYQPYYDYKALGYEEDYLRGYEFYVVDGLDYFYQKSSLRFRFLEKTFNVGKLSPIKSMRKIPVTAFLSLNSDLGGTRDPLYATGNDLSNRVLWGRGIGLDIIVYYVLVAQIEYSFNHLGEGGLFIHVRTGVD